MRSWRFRTWRLVLLYSFVHVSVVTRSLIIIFGCCLIRLCREFASSRVILWVVTQVSSTSSTEGSFGMLTNRIRKIIFQLNTPSIQVRILDSLDDTEICVSYMEVDSRYSDFHERTPPPEPLDLHSTPAQRALFTFQNDLYKTSIIEIDVKKVSETTTSRKYSASACKFISAFSCVMVNVSTAPRFRFAGIDYRRDRIKELRPYEHSLAMKIFEDLILLSLSFVIRYRSLVEIILEGKQCSLSGS